MKNKEEYVISITKDGDIFCALMGLNLVAGVAGFGENIVDALLDLIVNIEAKDNIFLYI